MQPFLLYSTLTTVALGGAVVAAFAKRSDHRTQGAAVTVLALLAGVWTFRDSMSLNTLVAAEGIVLGLGSLGVSRFTTDPVARCAGWAGAAWAVGITFFYLVVA